MSPNSKLIITVFIVVTAELLSIVFLAQSTRDKLYSNLVAQEIEKRQVLARHLAQHIEDDTVNVQDKLSLIAQRLEIRSGSSAECNHQLDQAFQALKSKISDLVRADAKGQIYCASNKDAIGIDITKDQDLKRLIEDPNHPSVVHRITFSPVSNQHVAGLHIPVYGVSGKFVGSLGGVIYFGEFEEKFFNGLIIEKNNLELIDDNGDILYSTSKELVGKNLLSPEIVKLVPENKQEEYSQLLKQALVDASQGKSSTVSTSFPSSRDETKVYYPIKLTAGRHWLISMSIPLKEIIYKVDQDSLILHVKSSSILIISIITIVLVTQISLFYYLMAHLKKHHSSKDLI